MPAGRQRAASGPGLLSAVLPLTSLALAVVAGITAPLGARQATVDDLFRPWQSPDSPGAAVLVIQDNQVVLSKGYGMANLEHGIPIRPDTVFDIASVSKQFAGMTIALLESEGRISLDDDVRRYLPELSDFGQRITIRHLVHHTSGLRDWPNSLSMGGWSYEDVMSFDQILRMAFRQRELNFPPGEAYLYSNTGYNLLAEIVTRVSGQSFTQFADDRIFKPLGMRHTHFHADHGVVIRNRAESYRPSHEGMFRHVVSNLTALGSSSLFTTVDDLAKWIGNLHSREPVVGGASVIARLHERGKLNNGETVAYAFGQTLGEYRGLRVVNHTGSWAGYRSVLERFPDQQFAVAILANTTNINPSALARQIADIYLDGRLGPRPTPSAPAGQPTTGTSVESWQPSTTELETYAGDYRSVELQTGYTVTVRNGVLVAEHFRTGEVQLKPVERDRFQGSTLGDVRFRRDAAGTVTSFTANTDRVRGLRFERVGR
jgi:CubicO group peptidase (beta-lactamase class C family)